MTNAPDILSVKMKQRCFCHDYYERGIYMITLEVEGRRPILGRLEGCAVAKTPLGESVEACWREIPRRHPEIQLLACIVMPDGDDEAENKPQNAAEKADAARLHEEHRADIAHIAAERLHNSDFLRALGDGHDHRIGNTDGRDQKRDRAKAAEHPPLDRRISKYEYEIALNTMIELGFDNGYVQSRRSAQKDFIPDFQSLEGLI